MEGFLVVSFPDPAPLWGKEGLGSFSLVPRPPRVKEGLGGIFSRLSLVSYPAAPPTGERSVRELLTKNWSYRRHIRIIRTPCLVGDAYAAPPTKVHGLWMHVTPFCDLTGDIVFSRCQTKKCVNSYQTPFPRDEWVESGHDTRLSSSWHYGCFVIRKWGRLHICAFTDTKKSWDVNADKMPLTL